LYLIEECGGNPKYKNGVKDCSQCIANHDENSYEHVMKVLNKVFKHIESTGEMPFAQINKK
jgi:Zn-finger protein